MTSDESGVGVAGSSSLNPLWLCFFPIHAYYDRVQASLITTIPAFTTIAISTTAVSNRTTTSSTITTKWKFGRASLKASPSAYAFLLFHVPLDPILLSILTPIRAPVWQQIPSLFAWCLQGTPIISSPWESMDCVWTRQKVCPPLKLLQKFLNHLTDIPRRYQPKRHCQYLVEIDDQTVHHSGGE